MQSHSSMKQYQDQVNLLEQRNLTQQSKNERLERELRVMGDRLTSLETRQREMSEGESMVSKVQIQTGERTYKSFNMAGGDMT